MYRIVTHTNFSRSYLYLFLALVFSTVFLVGNVQPLAALENEDPNAEDPSPPEDPQDVEPELYINEIGFQGAGSEDDPDWVELVNLGTVPVDNLGDYFVCVKSVQCHQVSSFFPDEPNPPYDNFEPGDLLLLYWPDNLKLENTSLSLYREYPNFFKGQDKVLGDLVDLVRWGTDIPENEQDFIAKAVAMGKAEVLDIDPSVLDPDVTISRVGTPYSHLLQNGGTTQDPSDSSNTLSRGSDDDDNEADDEVDDDEESDDLNNGAAFFFDFMSPSQITHNPGLGRYFRILTPREDAVFSEGQAIPFGYYIINFDDTFEFGNDDVLKIYLDDVQIDEVGNDEHAEGIFFEEDYDNLAGLASGEYTVVAKLATNTVLAPDVYIPQDSVTFNILEIDDAPPPPPTEVPPTDVATEVPAEPTATLEPAPTATPATEVPPVLDSEVPPAADNTAPDVEDIVTKPTETATATATLEPTATKTSTATSTATATKTATVTSTATATNTATKTSTATQTSTATNTATATPLPEVDTDGLSFDAECPEGADACRDTDKDGKPDWADADDENDGLDTALENPDPNGDGDPSDAQDTDKDGTPDYLDADDDGNGIDTIVEVNAPNQGDGNNDGVPDALQNNVASLTTAEDDEEYVTVEFEGTCEDLVVDNTLRESDVIERDENYDYPYGLIDYRLGCGSTGGESEVTLLLHDVSDPTGLVLRKYGPTTPSGPETDWYSYDATFGTVEIDGKTVVTVTFMIKDGALGDDTAADGIIYDPLGIAVQPEVGATATATATNTATPTFTPVSNSVASSTGTATTAAATATNTATPTFTPVAGATATNTATATFTPVAGATATATPVSTATPVAVAAANLNADTNTIASNSAGSNNSLRTATATATSAAEGATPTATATTAAENNAVANTAANTAVPTNTAAPVQASTAELAVDVRANRALSQIGQEVVYKVTVTNQGSAVANDVVLRNVLSAQLDYIGGFGSQGNVAYDSAIREVTANVGTLGTNESATITVTTRVNETATAGVAVDNAVFVYGDGIGQVNSNVAGVQIIPAALPETGFFNPIMFIVAGVMAAIAGLIGMFMVFGGAVSKASQTR